MVDLKIFDIANKCFFSVIFFYLNTIVFSTYICTLKNYFILSKCRYHKSNVSNNNFLTKNVPFYFSYCSSYIHLVKFFICYFFSLLNCTYSRFDINMPQKKAPITHRIRTLNTHVGSCFVDIDYSR